MKGEAASRGIRAAVSVVRRLLVFVLAARLAQTEHQKQAREGIAAPAKKTRGVLTAAGRVRERGGDHDAFEGRDGGVEQTRVACAQALFRPVLEMGFPIETGV